MQHLLDQFGVMVRDGGGQLAARSLEAVRKHLQMDVAYVSELVEDQSVFRAIDAPGLEHLASVGDSLPIDDVYCRHIVEGRLPELIPDTAAEPLALSLPITAALPIGAHVSVPIRRDNGEVYGMFCCLSATPRPSLNARDLHIVRAFAGLVAEEIGREAAIRTETARRRARVADAFAPSAFHVVLQPICSLLSRETLGYEALSRFACEPRRSPDLWFAEAGEVGRGVELECAAIERALALLPLIPAPLFLSVNASPAAVTGGALTALLADHLLDRVTLELTEHAVVADYEALCAALAPLRGRGLKIAVDDAGAGFAGLQHILRIRPDIIKLDLQLIRDIDADPARRALAAAMQTFARQTGATLVAEGVETAAELHTLAALGFQRGQGYLLGRPVAADQVLGPPVLIAAG